MFRVLQKGAWAATSPALTRSMSSVKLPDLPYDYGALEPYISGHIMELHHQKHHATYVANLNKAMEQQAEAESKGDVAKVISLQSAIKFNGGGVCANASYGSHFRDKAVPC